MKVSVNAFIRVFLKKSPKEEPFRERGRRGAHRRPFRERKVVLGNRNDRNNFGAFTRVFFRHGFHPTIHAEEDPQGDNNADR